MDFQSAIHAHVSWKAKLATYIAKPDRSLNAAEVSKDGGCELGKWLASEKPKHASDPKFVELMADHSRFHKAAGEVIKKADSGQSVAEEVALEGKSEFSQASSAVISKLMKLKSKVAA
jgi:hypothetical protein